MTIESLIKQGDESIKSKDYFGAIQSYSNAIKQNPQAFQAFLKRSNAYQKLSNYSKAKEDISTAFTIANDRGKRNEIGLCYFKLGLIYYGEKKLKLALTQFNKAIEFDCTEPTLEMWKNKTAYDLENHPEWNIDEEDEEEEKEEKREDPVEQVTKQISSSNIDQINKIAPLNVKIREDWYQTNDEIIITIYAKNINKDKLKIEFESNSISISFPNSSNSEYNYNLDPLYKEIDVSNSSYKVYSTKLEIILKKLQNIKWPTLEKSNEEEVKETTTTTTNDNSTPAYPSSSRKKVNWNNFKVDDEKEDQDANDFFKTIFKDVDEDSRRAMMKSYVQSNGTVLTTSWDEAKNKEFETSPPEGMIEKNGINNLVGV